MQLSGLDLRVSSEMLTDQRVGSAVAGSSDLVGVSTTHGAEVLFQAQDGSLHNVHRDPASDSGWVSTPLPPIHGASGLTVAQAGGVPTALCIGTNLAAPSLWTSTRSGSSWSAWAERPVPAQARQNYIVRVVPDLSGAAATVYLFLRGSSASPTPGALTLWRIDWTTNVWTSLGGVASTQGAAVNLNGSEGFVAFVGTETPNRWALVLHPMDGTPTPVANTLAVRQLATVRDASGRSSVFLYDPGLLTGTPRLAVVKAPTSTNPPVIDTGVSLQGLLPVDAGAATEALYALGRDGSLLAFHPSGATASGWTSTPMPLGVHLSDAVSVLGQDGSPTLFGLDHADQFVRLTLPVGADGTSGMWEQETVDLPAQSMVRVDAYATHLSVTDASGRPRLFETVALYADEVVSAEVNHEHVVLGPTTPTSVTTDGNGQITILSATDSLQSADLRVTVGEGADASTAHAARTGTTLKRLKGTTQAQLGTILPASMKPHAAVIQEALQRTAALEHQRPVGIRLGGDLVLPDPAEVFAGQLVVADAQQAATDRLAFLGLEGLVARHLPHHAGPVGELQRDDRLRPEGRAALDEAQQQQADDREQADREGPRGRPDHRVAVRQRRALALAPLARLALRCSRRHGLLSFQGQAHSWCARLRKCWRTDSASVFTAKVIANSVNAARNNVR